MVRFLILLVLKMIEAMNFTLSMKAGSSVLGRWVDSKPPYVVSCFGCTAAN